MISLVGYTGFVGSNLNNSYCFDHVYNSKNIEEAFGTNPDVLVYAGIRAEKFLANSHPQEDLDNIKNAIENIRKIQPQKLVLISTVDVYVSTLEMDEDADMSQDQLEPYGTNRLYLEQWVKENMDQYLILRLPALYGMNLKKNFIYDMIHKTPALLTETKFLELCEKDNFIQPYYEKLPNGFYACKDGKTCRPYFETIGFSALQFTDSRSIFQFYPLSYLWNHIEEALAKDIKVLNLGTEPISAAEFYQYMYGEDFKNELEKLPFSYDMRTKHYDNGYVFDKQFLLEDMKAFVKDAVEKIR